MPKTELKIGRIYEIHLLDHGQHSGGNEDLKPYPAVAYGELMEIGDTYIVLRTWKFPTSPVNDEMSTIVSAAITKIKELK